MLGESFIGGSTESTLYHAARIVHFLNKQIKVTFFSILFILSLGMLLYTEGLNFVNISNQVNILGVSVNIIFAGSLFAAVSWVSALIKKIELLLSRNNGNFLLQTVMMMAWPFYVYAQAN